MGGVGMESNRASAPYNFIPFEDFTVKATDELISHDRFDKKRKTGKITYTLVNETEIFVGGNKDLDADGVEHFFGDNENFIIPGSTMRGFIRANAEILSLSYPDMIEDRRMMYRSFADKCVALRNQYSEKMRGANDEKMTSFKQSVRAGYLYWENEHKLCIVPAKEFEGRGCNYVSIHESDLRKHGILQNENQYMYTKQIKKMSDMGYEKNISRFDKEKKYRGYLKPFTKRECKPYGNQPFNGRSQILQFGYDGKHITDFNDGQCKGYLFNSQWIYGKVNHYLINEMSQKEIKNADIKYVIDKELVQSFEKDLEIRKQQNKTLISQDYFYNLPYENGQKKIGVKYAKIFFFRTDKDGKVSDFGPTPFFRTFYKKSIKDALPTKPLESGYDFASSVFGFVDEKGTEHYEGRVNFMNCILPKTKAKESESSCNVVLMGPKPTAFQLYLVQENDNIRSLQTYNEEGNKLKLRGRKFYWKKDKVERNVEVANRNLGTRFYPLESRQRFQGEIYFENLSEKELGMLLSAMPMDDGETDNIGHGKPYGFGRIRFENVQVLYEDKEQAFLSLDSGYEEAWVKDVQEIRNLNEFKSYIEDKINDIIDSSESDEGKSKLVKEETERYFDIVHAGNEKCVEILYTKYDEYLLKKIVESKNWMEEEDEEEKNEKRQANIYDMACKTEMFARKIKMNQEILKLKGKFEEFMNDATEKQYSDLKSISTYSKVKSTKSVDLALKDKYSYMPLKLFKDRFILDEAAKLI